MKKAKSLIAILSVVLVCAAIFFGIYYFKNWPLRFRSEFNAFFGAGNWQCISTNLDTSSIHLSHTSNTETTLFHTWEISFTNNFGESEIWQISDLTLKSNHEKHRGFSKKRLSAKQALMLDFMYDSFDLVGEQVRKNVLYEVLPKAEADCFNVRVSFHGSNPPPRLYSKLRNEPWFNVNDISADAYLQSDLYDFYIDLAIHDYRFGTLSEAEQKHLTESLGAIESALKSHYGEYADYKINMGGDLTAEFSASDTTTH